MRRSAGFISCRMQTDDTPVTLLDPSLPRAQTRRHRTFLGSDHGGRTAAILKSIATTYNFLGVDPFEYVRDVFGRIRAHPQNLLDDLLPGTWKAARDVTAA
jgi:hypothetical protein